MAYEGPSQWLGLTPWASTQLRQVGASAVSCAKWGSSPMHVAAQDLTWIDVFVIREKAMFLDKMWDRF